MLVTNIKQLLKIEPKTRVVYAVASSENANIDDVIIPFLLMIYDKSSDPETVSFCYMLST